MRNSKYRINKIDYMVWQSDRQMVRFFVGMASLIWAGLEFWALYSSVPPGLSFFSQTIRFSILSPYAWPVLFSIQGIAAVYAVISDCRHYSLLFVENILGCLLWGSLAVLAVIGYDPNSMPPAHISLSITMFLITMWLTMRADHGV